MGHAALENVYEEIGFNQNLIIDAVDVRVRVVVADEIADALRLPMSITARGQHFECDGPVSYTHLDVYKRQPVRTPDE